MVGMSLIFCMALLGYGQCGRPGDALQMRLAAGSATVTLVRLLNSLFNGPWSHRTGQIEDNFRDFLMREFWNAYERRDANTIRVLERFGLDLSSILFREGIQRDNYDLADYLANHIFKDLANPLNRAPYEFSISYVFAMVWLKKDLEFSMKRLMDLCLLLGYYPAGADLPDFRQLDYDPMLRLKQLLELNEHGQSLFFKYLNKIKEESLLHIDLHVMREGLIAFKNLLSAYTESSLSGIETIRKGLDGLITELVTGNNSGV